jgi:hypothetical protein
LAPGNVDHLPLRIPPNVTIASPKNTTYTTTSIPFNITSIEPAVAWLYSLNGGPNVSFSLNITMTNTTITAREGANQLVVWFQDWTGLWENITVYFTVSVPRIESAMLDIAPDTHNLKSGGRWITGYLELPEGYDVADIELSTIELNGVVQAEESPTEVGDSDGDGVPDLVVKFDRESVQGILSPGDEVEITVKGELSEGMAFVGTDTIRVINRGGK